jgi:anthranilate synthase component 2
MKILLIDNYDSFTYNLVRCFDDFAGIELIVLRNDEMQNIPTDIDRLIISPGPGVPSENGEIISCIRHFHDKIPILGVCLGMQAIYEAMGGKLKNLRDVHHGVASKVKYADSKDKLFNGMENPFIAGRYHSWVCDPIHLPENIIPLAWDEYDEMMACRHKTYPVYGVQFHPESFLTVEGNKLLQNFVELT